MTSQTRPFAAAALLVLSAVALAACGRSPTGPMPAQGAAQGPEVPEVATLEADEPTGTARAATAAQVSPDTSDELSRREAELAQRERELRVQQEELRHERERLEAGRGGGRPESSVDEVWYDADQATTTAAASSTGSSIRKMPTQPIVVPPGTQLEIALAANVSSRIARVGDRVEGRLASDLVVGEQRAAVAGAAVTGTVTELASGDDQVAGVQTLGLTFDSLQAANGATIPIVAKFRRQGDSERAQQTGGEVKLRAGTVITAPTETSIAIY